MPLRPTRTCTTGVRVGVIVGSGVTVGSAVVGDGVGWGTGTAEGRIVDVGGGVAGVGAAVVG